MPCWPADVLARAIAAAHEEGARVTAHCFGEDVAARPRRRRHRLHRARTAACEPDTIASFAAQGIAIVPTLVNIETFPQIAEPARREVPRLPPPHAATCTTGGTTTVAAAREAGIPVYVGTDAGGSLAARPGRHRGGAPRARRVHDDRGAAGRRAGGPAPGWAGPGSRRGTRPTWSSTPTTRARTSPPWPRRRSSCCAARPSTSPERGSGSTRPISARLRRGRRLAALLCVGASRRPARARGPARRGGRAPTRPPRRPTTSDEARRRRSAWLGGVDPVAAQQGAGVGEDDDAADGGAEDARRDVAHQPGRDRGRDQRRRRAGRPPRRRRCPAVPSASRKPMLAATRRRGTRWCRSSR